MTDKGRRLLFRLGTALVLVALGAVMFVVGRGHTVYFDNKTLEYNGASYPSVYRAEVFRGEEKIATLGKRERGMLTLMGQSLRVRFTLTAEKGGEAVEYPLEISLPYGMDGIVLNLPALAAGLPREAYLSQFIPQAPTEPEETVAPEDELLVTDL